MIKKITLQCVFETCHCLTAVLLYTVGFNLCYFELIYALSLRYIWRLVCVLTKLLTGVLRYLIK